MDFNNWLALIGTLGGFEAVRWGITFWTNRKTNARKDDAAADAVEVKNLLIVINTLKEEITRISAEKLKRDEKVDFLYAELRKSEEKALNLIREKHELELRLKEAEIKKCDVRGCINRQPPSDY